MAQPLSRACRLPARLTFPQDPERPSLATLLTRIGLDEAGFELTCSVAPELPPETLVAVAFQLPGCPVDLIARAQGATLRAVHFPLFEAARVRRWLRPPGPTPVLAS